MSFCSVPEIRSRIHALLFRHRQVHGPEHRRRRVDGHGDRDLAQRNAAEQSLHVFERGDRRAAFAHFALRQRVVGVVAHQGRADRRPPRARSAPAPAGSGSGGWFPPAWRSRRTGAWSRGAPGTWSRGCRACTGIGRVEEISFVMRRAVIAACCRKGWVSDPLRRAGATVGEIDRHCEDEDDGQKVLISHGRASRYPSLPVRSFRCARDKWVFRVYSHSMVPGGLCVRS